MLIDLSPDGGGVLIVGTVEELDQFSDTIIKAMAEGQAEGQILTQEAVERLTVRTVGEVDDA